MNKMINIGGSVDDPHYRYKRNKIEVIHINKNEGTTKITNKATIQKQLNMPEPFILAYYKRIQKKRGIMMIAPGEFRGVISSEDLELILIEMINRYVLCPQCKLPEWNQVMCNACGYMKNNNIEPAITVADVKYINSEPTDNTVKLACLLYEIRSKEDHESDRFKKINKLLDVFWELKSGVDENIWKKNARLLICSQ
jgi:translation initiation factor 2 beta subunit (eIF-2beta)/eIF-5